MQSYEINQGKRKKAIKQVVKANVKTSKIHCKLLMECMFLRHMVIKDQV